VGVRLTRESKTPEVKAPEVEQPASVEEKKPVETKPKAEPIAEEKPVETATPPKSVLVVSKGKSLITKGGRIRGPGDAISAHELPGGEDQLMRLKELGFLVEVK